MNIVKSPKFPLIMFFVSGLSAILLTVFLFDNDILKDVFRTRTYYFIWITVCSLLYLINKKFPFSLMISSENVKKNFMPFVYGFGLTVIIFSVVEPDFRVLADETNLLNVSQAFYQLREFSHPIESDYYYDMRHFINPAIPHRPGLWPFFASILHTILGYSSHNAFILNFIISWAILTTIVFIGEILIHRFLGYIAALLLAVYPIFTLNATSGGFDPINLLFLLWVGISLTSFIKKPDGVTFEILLVLFALNAQCRYESVILLFPISIAFIWKYRPSVLKHSNVLFSLLPFLFLPILWQRILSPELVNEGDKGKVALLFSIIPEHAANAWEFFFQKGNPEFPNSPLIGILAIIGIILAVIHFFKYYAEKETFWAVGLVALGNILIAIIHFAYYLGDYRFAFIMRYSVAHLGIISLFAAYPIYVAYEYKQWKIQSILFLIFIAFISLPVAAKNERGKSLFLHRDFKICRKYIESLGTNNVLVITDRPSMYTALGVGSLNFEYSNSNAQLIIHNLKRHLYRNVFVIQHIRYTDNSAVESLNPEYELEPVLEFQNSEVDYVRLAKVIAK